MESEEPLKNKSLESKSTERKIKSKGILEILIIPLTITIVSAIATIFITGAQMKSSEQMAKAQLEAQYLKIFYTKITSKNPKDQEDAMKYINVLSSDLAVKLANIVQGDKALAPKTREIASNIGMQLAQKLKAKYKIGIYYLEKSENSEKLAKEVAEMLKDEHFRYSFYPKNKAFFRRITPAKTTEIRYFGDEISIARLILSVLKINADFEDAKIQGVLTATPKFVSIIIPYEETNQIIYLK